MYNLKINLNQYLELQKIGIDAFYPLIGFMDEVDFISVVESMRLSNGSIFPLPIVLDVNENDLQNIELHKNILLEFNNEVVGEILVNSIYRWDKLETTKKVFGVIDENHPGVLRMLSLQDFLIGGPIKIYEPAYKFLFNEELNPKQTKLHFEKMGWKRIAGFQTRNVPHRAHEYLHRIALEYCDGLFIQPLLGNKKLGDYTADAIMRSYRVLTNDFLPKNRVLLGVLSTAMRYAGPREALFHALIRRNYGCTDFIVGRDHAGVGNFYGLYDAQSLALKYEKELGIKILNFKGPFYCKICDCIATENTCDHSETNNDAVIEISGTLMRKILNESSIPRSELMRKEIINSLDGIKIFID